MRKERLFPKLWEKNEGKKISCLSCFYFSFSSRRTPPILTAPGSIRGKRVLTPMFRCTKGLGHIIPHSSFHPRFSLRHVSHVLYENSTYACSPCSDPSIQLQLPPTPQAWGSGQGIWLTRQNQLDNKWSQLRCSLITLRCEPLQHYFYFVSPRGGLSEGRVGKCKQAVRLECSDSPVPPTAPGLRQAWRLPRKGGHHEKKPLTGSQKAPWNRYSVGVLNSKREWGASRVPHIPYPTQWFQRHLLGSKSSVITSRNNSRKPHCLLCGGLDTIPW